MSLDDMRPHTAFLAQPLPDALVRFAEGRCVRPKPQPLPPVFAKIYGKADGPSS